MTAPEPDVFPRLGVVEWPQPGAARRAFGGFWVVEQRTPGGYTPLLGPFRDTTCGRIPGAYRAALQACYDAAVFMA